MGYQDFSTEMGRQLIGSYDFMITVGKADANPTTILEAMAWGLVPVCTPQSGYSGYPSIVNIPLDNLREAVATLRQLQTIPENALIEKQKTNWRLIDTHFNWDRFARQVIEVIASDANPSLTPVSPFRRLYLTWCASTSPLAPWHPFNLGRTLLRYYRQWIATGRK
jgi:hypothetical protein